MTTATIDLKDRMSLGRVASLGKNAGDIGIGLLMCRPGESSDRRYRQTC
jgi:hypothetical protein